MSSCRSFVRVNVGGEPVGRFRQSSKKVKRVSFIGNCEGYYPTIGYGHVVKDDEDFSAGIDEAKGEELLRQDAQIAERAVLRLINVPLTDGQFDALVSFTYNLGGGALQRSTLRSKVNREEHAEVPEQFLRWVWAGERKLKGLVRRRAAEVKVYLNNQ